MPKRKNNNEEFKYQYVVELQDISGGVYADISCNAEELNRAFKQEVLDYPNSIFETAEDVYFAHLSIEATNLARLIKPLTKFIRENAPQVQVLLNVSPTKAIQMRAIDLEYLQGLDRNDLVELLQRQHCIKLGFAGATLEANQEQIASLVRNAIVAVLQGRSAGVETPTPTIEIKIAPHQDDEWRPKTPRA